MNIHERRQSAINLLLLYNVHVVYCIKYTLRRWITAADSENYLGTDAKIKLKLRMEGQFPLRLRVAMRGERYRDTDSVSISLATQCNATQRAPVMEIHLKSFIE